MIDKPSVPHVLRCDEKHLKNIRDIFNEAILQTTALYEESPRSEATIAAWFEEKKQAGIPVFGVEQQGTVVGFATWGPFRPYPAYSKTAEHSVYIATEYQRRGLGRILLDIQFDPEQQDELLVEVKCLQKLSSDALWHLRSEIKAAWFESPSDAKGDMSFIDLEFWQRTENLFFDAIARLMEDIENERQQLSTEAAKAWLTKLQSIVLDLFDEYA